jgi:hypothetical protein
MEVSSLRLDTLVGQFLLQRKRTDVPDDWTVLRADDWVLHAHPSLPLTDIVSADGVAMGWLIGQATQDGAIVTHSLRVQSPQQQQLEDALYRLGGPWVAFLFGLDTPLLYADAFGQAAVVYSPQEEAVASSLFLIPRCSKTQWEDDLVAALGIPGSDNYYPFGLTPRRDVRRLLPSHALDLASWSASRRWPQQMPTRCVSVAAGAEVVASVLRDNIEALAAAYPLQISLTAGLDSRMIMAVLRKHAQTTTFVTNNSHPLTAAVDIAAARYFARRFRLTHIVRPRLGELAAQDLLGAPVGGADEVARPLDRDLEMLDLAEVAHEVPRGLVGRLHHDVDVGRAERHGLLTSICWLPVGRTAGGAQSRARST